MGRELVLNLLSKSAKVIAIDVNEAGLNETLALAGDWKGSLGTFVVDISNKISVEKLFNDVMAQYGHLDGIINNAGIIQPFMKVNDLGYDAIERVMNDPSLRERLAQAGPERARPFTWERAAEQTLKALLEQ